MESSSTVPNYDRIVNYLKNLESRISRIETHLNIGSLSEGDEFKLPPLIPSNISERADSLELQIGQFWFAKAGIVVLAIGIIFLLTFPYHDLPPAFPSLFGYFLAGALILLSHYWRNTFTFVSRYIFGGSLALIYFTTLRLHFFSANPVVTNRAVEVIALLIFTAVHLIISYKRKSVYLAGIGIAFGFLTALISGNPFIIFILLTLNAALIVYLKLKFDWNNLFVYGIILTYISHFLWFINNPFWGNKIQLVSSPYINVFFILLYSTIFSLGNLLRSKDCPEDYKVIVSTFLNCFFSYGLFLLITLTKFNETLALSHLIASILFLIISFLFWSKEKSKYSTFFFAILGYTALSVSIIVQFNKPDFFVWLCWQSLIVVSTAVLFRSKIIIVANFVIYLIIFFTYLIIAGSMDIVSLSFGFVALLSARILNWQRNRLELKTEIMRISYLATAFFIFPYALYHIVPRDYVGLSWISVALFYYLISIVLKNKKYRWMALLTLLLTVFYILFIGITKLEPVYRIISFLVLGIVLIIISIFYTRMKTTRSTVSGNDGVEDKNPESEKEK